LAVLSCSWLCGEWLGAGSQIWPLESFLEWQLRRWSRHLSDPPICTACQFGYPRSLSQLSRLLCSVLGSGPGFWEEDGNPRLSSRLPTPTLNQDLAGALRSAHRAAAIFFQSRDSYEKLKVGSDFGGAQTESPLGFCADESVQDSARSSSQSPNGASAPTCRAGRHPKAARRGPLCP